MFDLLTAKGTIEILNYLAKYNMNTIRVSDLNNKLQKQNLTTATIYRRAKELELAGFISKDETNAIKITNKGLDVLRTFANRGKISPELKIRRSSRRILIILDKHDDLSVTELQQYGFSPTTVQRSIKELQENRLVKTEKEPSSSHKAGRPRKKIKLTKKARKYLEEHEKLTKN